MNRKLQENFRMNEEITKVRWNKLGLKIFTTTYLERMSWKLHLLGKEKPDLSRTSPALHGQ